MKIIKKSRYKTQDAVDSLTNQRKILPQLSFPFIAKLRYTFQTERKLYFIFDYFHGGRLSFHLQSNLFFPEEIAKFYLAQIVWIIDYLHSHNVISRLLMPESFIIDNSGYLKWIDFTYIIDNIDKDYDCISSSCGLHEYTAPEIINFQDTQSGCFHGLGYGKAVDIWAFGILVYEMWLGFPPFSDDNIYYWKRKIICNEDLIFGDGNGNPISQEAKDWIHLCLNKNRTKRIKIKDVKEHFFFNGVNFDNLLNRKWDKIPIKINDTEDEYIDPKLLTVKAQDSPNNSFTHLWKSHFSNFDYIQDLESWEREEEEYEKEVKDANGNVDLWSQFM